MTQTTQYGVLPAPGYHGDTLTCASAHKTEAAALKAVKGQARLRVVWREDGWQKGQRVFRGPLQDMINTGHARECAA